MYKVNVNGL